MTSRKRLFDDTVALIRGSREAVCDATGAYSPSFSKLKKHRVLSSHALLCAPDAPLPLDPPAATGKSFDRMAVFILVALTYVCHAR